MHFVHVLARILRLESNYSINAQNTKRFKCNLDSNGGLVNGYFLGDIRDSRDEFSNANEGIFGQN